MRVEEDEEDWGIDEPEDIARFLTKFEERSQSYYTEVDKPLVASLLSLLAIVAQRDINHKRLYSIQDRRYYMTLLGASFASNRDNWVQQFKAPNLDGYIDENGERIRVGCTFAVGHPYQYVVIPGTLISSIFFRVDGQIKAHLLTGEVSGLSDSERVNLQTTFDNLKEEVKRFEHGAKMGFDNEDY